MKRKRQPTNQPANQLQQQRILPKSFLYKFLLITLALCCLINGINAGRLPRGHSTVHTSDIATSNKAEIASAVIVTPIPNETSNKNKTEDVDDNDDNDDNDDDEEDDDDTAISNKNEDDKEDDDDIDDDDDEDKQTAEKNALQPAADSSLSVWGIVRGLWNWIRDDISESLFGADDVKTPAVGEGRTFGKIRRLQMALIPIVFKFGVLSAMVAFLVALGIKTLFLVKVLVFMNLLAILAKFFTIKANFGHEHVAPAVPVWNWTPYSSHGWQSSPVEHHTNKEIHLHIHGGQGQPQVSSYTYGNTDAGVGAHSGGWERRSDPYSAYDNIALQSQQNDLVAGDLAIEESSTNSKYSGHFPSNHRML
ncbi:uncharacterized protein ACRADG_003240 [Cochliomyia hominivorax]